MSRDSGRESPIQAAGARRQGLSAAFRLADAIVEGMAADDPVTATINGVTGYEDRLTDYSPVGASSREAHWWGWLQEVQAAQPASTWDRLAVQVIRERLEVRLLLHASGEHLRHCNAEDSPVQAIPAALALTPTQPPGDWEVLARRLEAVPDCVGSLREAYLTGVSDALPPARRQVLAASRSARALDDAGDRPWFVGLVAGYPGGDDALRRRLLLAAREAGRCFGELADWLRDELAPRAAVTDSVGAQRYALFARFHCGTDLDLAETYEWGWAELADVAARLQVCAQRLYPGLTPQQARRELERDPERAPLPQETTVQLLQALTDDTVALLDGTCFDIPPVLRSCEVRVAPPGGPMVPYYTPPSEDLLRPGVGWLPSGALMLPPWWLRALWFHETVPGHHLQYGIALLQQRLSRFQRVESVTAHGEGWAVYAERLMDEFGGYGDPAVELGYLSGRALRVARVVLDIGLHLNRVVPDAVPAWVRAGMTEDPRGQQWSVSLATDFLATVAGLAPVIAKREVLRYLGSPGQALAYAVGERAWLEAREAARAYAGDGFDLKAWHMRMLGLGPVPLTVLAQPPDEAKALTRALEP